MPRRETQRMRCDARTEADEGMDASFCKLDPDHAGDHFMVSRCPECGDLVEGSWAIHQGTRMCISCAFEAQHPNEARSRRLDEHDVRAKARETCIRLGLRPESEDIIMEIFESIIERLDHA